MSSATISIFGNKILLEIMNELKIFSKFNVVFLEDKKSWNNNQIIIFFYQKDYEELYNKIIKKNIPIILIMNSKNETNIIKNEFTEKLNKPFNILELNKKIVLLLARHQFYKSSLINLNDYIIDKNERKIKKNNVELQLTEKEISFLILFTKSKKPIEKKFILESVWKYSVESDTHTIETHIHRLRKKIYEKFKDNNFIKNDSRGYYI